MPILNWLTRYEDIRAAQRVPYRLLEEVPELGYGDRDAGNMLIQGDNLKALKALMPYCAGQVKSTYIAAARRAAGRPIAQADCQIASIAHVCGATIATRNTRDFECCGIDLINPWTAA